MITINLTFLYIIYVLLEMFADGFLLNAGSRIYEHTTRFLRRGLVTFIFALHAKPEIYFVSLQFLAWACLFYVIFNPSLNMVRNKDFWHLGKTATIDRFFNQNDWTRLWYKFIWGKCLVLWFYLDLIVLG